LGNSTKLISHNLGTFNINYFLPKLLESYGSGAPPERNNRVYTHDWASGIDDLCGVNESHSELCSSFITSTLIKLVEKKKNNNFGNSIF
jgi:hypothetical protein